MDVAKSTTFVFGCITFELVFFQNSLACLIRIVRLAALIVDSARIAEPPVCERLGLIRNFIVEEPVLPEMNNACIHDFYREMNT